MAIEFTYGGIDYELEYTRKSIETMEKSGFVPEEIASKPVTTIPMLFKGAFLAHHRFTKSDLIDEIYKAMPNKSQLIDELAKMYSEPINDLFSDPDEVGKIEWTAKK